MKKIFTSIFVLIAASTTMLAQFTQGNLVVYQVGDGTAALGSTATAAFLKEYSTAGVATFSVAIPTTGGARLTNSGSATSEGYINRSTNGQYILVGGYDAAVGAAGVASTTSSSTARVIDTVNFGGTIGRAVSSNSFYSANNIRSTTSDGYNNYWAGGPTSGSTYMGSVTTPTVLISSAPNTRVVSVFNNQLYYSTSSGTAGIYKIGTGLPTTGLQTVALTFTTTASPYAYAFNATGDTCYVADDAAGIKKYVFNGTAWSAAYVLNTTNARGLTVDFSANPHIVYATTTQTSANTIIKITDVGASSTSTVIATAPANTAFRGIAFSPYCMPVTLLPISGNATICSNQSLNLTANFKGANLVTYTWAGAGSFNSTTIKNPVITNATTGIYTVTAINSCGTASTTISVTVNTQPTVTANTTNSVVCLGNQITLNGGGANTYTWSGGVADNVAFTPSVTTSYTVIGTDNHNCTNTATINVAVNNLPVVVANTSTTTICAGNQITLNGSGATTYTWSNGVIDNIAFTPSGTATYSVTGTDNNNCANTATVSVIVNNLPTISFTGKTTLCLWEVDTLTANGATSYTWSPFNNYTDQTIGAPTTPGNVTFTLTGIDANGCTNSLTQLITVNTPLPLSISATNTVVCAGNTTNLTATGAMTYTWSSGVMNGVDFTPSSTNTYTVIGTDLNHCSDTTTISVTVNNLPLVTANASTTTVCAGNQITLTGSGATTYTWSSGVNDNTAFTPSSTNSYTVTGTDNNNCVNTAIVFVTVNNLPTVIANTTNSVVCNGNQITLTGSGATTYTWSNGVNDNIAFTPSVTATYSVTGTDNNNCVNTATVSVTVNNLPTVVASTSTTTICLGNQITLNGSGATTYTWSSGVNNNVAFAPSATNSYTVTGADNNNCINTATVSVTVNNLPTVVANTSTTTVCAGNQITLNGSGATTYAWSSGVTNNTAFTPTITTTYTVTGTDNNNCVNTATVNVVVSNCTTTSIENSISQNAVSLYPNPTNGSFTIRTASLPANILLYDVNGKLIYSKQMEQQEEKIDLQIESGIYLLRLLSNGSIYSNRLLITK